MVSIRWLACAYMLTLDNVCINVGLSAQSDLSGFCVWSPLILEGLRSKLYIRIITIFWWKLGSIILLRHNYCIPKNILVIVKPNTVDIINCVSAVKRCEVVATRDEQSPMYLSLDKVELIELDAATTACLSILCCLMPRCCIIQLYCCM